MKKGLILILVMTACNQVVYDAAYRQIVNTAYQDPRRMKELDKVIVERNNAILMLRELCKGQKSSYEMEN